MKLSLIAAVSDNGVIGRDGELPWHVPGDLRFFKRVTMGKPVIMGRRTWESIRKPLPGRTNIVVTRQHGYRADGAEVTATLEDALALATEVATRDGVEELMVVGGEELYRLALPVADRLYITEVHADVEGDARFPAWDRSAWVEQRRERMPADDENGVAYSFVVYERPAADG